MNIMMGYFEIFHYVRIIKVHLPRILYSKPHFRGSLPPHQILGVPFRLIYDPVDHLPFFAAQNFLYVGAVMGRLLLSLRVRQQAERSSRLSFTVPITHFRHT